MRGPLSIAAPTKINLYLHIVGKQVDSIRPPGVPANEVLLYSFQALDLVPVVAGHESISLVQSG